MLYILQYDFGLATNVFFAKQNIEHLPWGDIIQYANIVTIDMLCV
jgi:hypothetical protein